MNTTTAHEKALLALRNSDLSTMESCRNWRGLVERSITACRAARLSAITQAEFVSLGEGIIVLEAQRAIIMEATKAVYRAILAGRREAA